MAVTRACPMFDCREIDIRQQYAGAKLRYRAGLLILLEIEANIAVNGATCEVGDGPHCFNYQRLARRKSAGLLTLSTASGSTEHVSGAGCARLRNRSNRRSAGAFEAELMGPKGFAPCDSGPPHRGYPEDIGIHLPRPLKNPD